MTSTETVFFRRPGNILDGVGFRGGRRTTPLEQSTRRYDLSLDGSALYSVRLAPSARSFEIVVERIPALVDSESSD